MLDFINLFYKKLVMFVFCSNNSFLPCFLFIYPAGTRSHNLSVAEKEHNSSSFSIPTQFCLSSSDFISSLTFNGKVWSAIIKPSLLSNSFSCTGLEIFWLQNVIWTHNPILCPNIFIFRNQAKANQFSKHRHFLAEFQTLSCIHLIPLHSKTSSQNTVFHELQTTSLTYTYNCYSHHSASITKQIFDFY